MKTQNAVIPAKAGIYPLYSNQSDASFRRRDNRQTTSFARSPEGIIL